MTDRAHGRASTQVSAARATGGRSGAPGKLQGPGAPRPRLQRSESQRSGSSRAAVRDELDAALRGTKLSDRDKQFLGRLVHWDKRNGSSVAALLWRARMAGRDEATLTPRQLEIVIAALEDAAVYRALGAETVSCWDCESIPSGRCPEHSRDADWARAYAETVAVLSAASAELSASACAGPGRSADQAAEALPRPTDIAKYRRRAPVAS
jgi:hypothetical protein